MLINDLIKGNKNLEVRFSKWNRFKTIIKRDKIRYFVYWL